MRLEVNLEWQATKGEGPTSTFADKYDLKAFFRDQVVLTDTFIFTVASKRFPLDEQRYFALEHQLKKKTIHHRLPVQGSSIHLHVMMMRNKKGKDIGRKITSTRLVYVDNEKGESQVFGPFQLRFLKAEEVARLREELRDIYGFVDSNSLAEFSQVHALLYLALHYGKMTE